MTELIKREHHGAVMTLTLNRPDALNALNPQVIAELGAAIDEVAGDEVLRALVLTGEGRAFAAGADIAAMRDMSPADAEAFSRNAHEIFAQLESLAVPTIAAVNGFALGGGCELALCCDWIYASDKARFGQPEVNLGLIPGFGGTSRLVRRVGLAWAKELVLTGRNIKADEALRVGLANQVFAPDDLIPQTLAAAEAIGAAGPVAVRLAKRVMQEGQGADLRVANALEQSAFGLVFATEDRDEGIRAFLEKGTPDFKAR